MFCPQKQFTALYLPCAQSYKCKHLNTGIYTVGQSSRTYHHTELHTSDRANMQDEIRYRQPDVFERNTPHNDFLLPVRYVGARTHALEHATRSVRCVGREKNRTYVDICQLGRPRPWHNIGSSVTISPRDIETWIALLSEVGRCTSTCNRAAQRGSLSTPRQCVSTRDADTFGHRLWSVPYASDAETSLLRRRKILAFLYQRY